MPGHRGVLLLVFGLVLADSGSQSQDDEEEGNEALLEGGSWYGLLKISVRLCLEELPFQVVGREARGRLARLDETAIGCGELTERLVRMAARLAFGCDDAPTQRYGPEIEARPAFTSIRPTPGPHSKTRQSPNARLADRLSRGAGLVLRSWPAGRQPSAGSKTGEPPSLSLV